MEEGQEARESLPEGTGESFGDAGFRHPSGAPEVMVLAVLFCFSLLFATLGVALFQALAEAAGWDTRILSGMLAADAPPEERWQMRLLLGISHIATFLLAGWATLRIFYRPAQASVRYLGAGSRPDWRVLWTGVLLILASVPLVLSLYEMNQALPIPETFRLLEEQTNEALKGLLQMDDFSELAANLALIALLPAIGEELVFRGLVQQQLMRRIRPQWIALAVAAAVFSFIHFQFEGFLPRMFLGLLLGWLYWVTGNFWVPVAAHFANNAIQVLGQYLYSRDLSTIDLEQDIQVPWYAAAVSLVLVVLLLRRIVRLQQALV